MTLINVYSGEAAINAQFLEAFKVLKGPGEFVFVPAAPDVVQPINEGAVEQQMYNALAELRRYIRQNDANRTDEQVAGKVQEILQKTRIGGSLCVALNDAEFAALEARIEKDQRLIVANGGKRQAEAESRIAALEGTLREVNALNAELTGHLGAVDARIAEAMNVRFAAVHGTLSETRAEVQRLGGVVITQVQQIDAQGVQITTLQQGNTVLSQQMAEQTQQIAEQMQQMQQIRVRNEELHHENRVLRQENDNLHHENQELRQKNQDLKKENTTLTNGANQTLRQKAFQGAKRLAAAGGSLLAISALVVLCPPVAGVLAAAGVEAGIGAALGAGAAGAAFAGAAKEVWEAPAPDSSLGNQDSILQAAGSPVMGAPQAVPEGGPAAQPHAIQMNAVGRENTAGRGNGANGINP